ncbi:MAG: hypothetical protein ACAH17_03490 [Candidatus Paceibacterota bacterium]
MSKTKKRTVVVYAIEFDQVFETESELPVADDVHGLFVNGIVLGDCVIVGEL